MAQRSYQVGSKATIFRGNKKHAVCDLRGTINMNTKTNYYSSPKIFELVEENTLFPGDEDYHVNHKNDLFLVISTTGSEYGG